MRNSSIRRIFTKKTVHRTTIDHPITGINICISRMEARVPEKMLILEMINRKLELIWTQDIPTSITDATIKIVKAMRKEIMVT